MSDEKHEHDFFDRIHMARMDWLTFMAKRFLPQGYWGDTPTSGEEQTLYLTFDDGPVPDTTLALLDLLEQESVPATFFVLGRRSQRYPELLAEIVKRGHALGNHSFSHEVLPLMSTKKIEHEIQHTNDLIEQACGVQPVLFRPPFGLLDSRGADCVKERKMKTIYWGAVSEDWLGIGEKRVVERTMRKLKHGTLIVLHEGRTISAQTLTATRQIIRKSKELGYKFGEIAV